MDRESALEIVGRARAKPVATACAADTRRVEAAWEIRPARAEEAPQLSDLSIRSKAVWGYDEAFMALARITLEVRASEIESRNVWVAEADGAPVGVVVLESGKDPESLDLARLFVAPERLRRGVGRALLAYAAAEAKRRGARRLTILSDPNAAAFYERNGAVRIGEAPSDAVPGRMLPLYELRLDRPPAPAGPSLPSAAG
jgi:GNAT superfamily N-acetyltransferase